MSKNPEVTAVTKALVRALARVGTRLGYQQAQQVVALMLQEKNYHALAAKLKSRKPPVAPGAPTEPLTGILVQVAPEFFPEAGTAFAAVVSALEHYEIRADLIEGSFRSVQQPTKEEATFATEVLPDRQKLAQLRAAEADLAFESYDFGKNVSVEDTSGWESFDGTWARTVYVLFKDAAELDAPTSRVRFLVMFESGSATISRCEATLDGEPIRKYPTACIHGRVFSVDQAESTTFDALPWFLQASDQDILALQSIHWSLDYAADAVAEHLADSHPNLAFVLGYARERGLGFEVAINATEAMAWLKLHRNGLWALMRCEEERVTLFAIPGHGEKWGWMPDFGKASDDSFDSKKSAALDAIKTLGLAP